MASIENRASAANVALPSGPEDAASKPSRRAYHKKVRTGCMTCKVRRLRCDEAKPACKRCVSTGRKCDGYVTTLSGRLPTASGIASLTSTSVWAHNAFADSALGLHRSQEELRSKRFFMEVTGPSMAGGLLQHFWQVEIPRAGKFDSAIRHALVSLGAAHESYISGAPANQNIVSLKYFNKSIQDLFAPGSHLDFWRTLTVCTIFTCICLLDGQIEQARLHFNSGLKLLREYEDSLHQVNSQRRHIDVSNEKRLLAQVPVSVNSIRTMMIAFELAEAKLHVQSNSEPPRLLSSHDGYSAWRLYTPPWRVPVFGRHLTPENLSKAIEASESLHMTLVFASLEQVKHMKRLYAQGGFQRLELAGPPHLGSHVQAFVQIEKAFGLFRKDFKATTESRSSEWREIRKGFASLSTMQASNRLLLEHDPDESDQQRRLQSLPSLCNDIVKNGEKVLDLESNIGCLRNGGLIPTASVMTSLSLVARSGFNRATRKRAIFLLNKPRVEGLWDSRMAGQISEAILERETEATEEYSKKAELDDIFINNPTARGWEDEADRGENIHPLARSYNYIMDFTGSRKLRIVVWTWKEWLEDSPGQELRVGW